MTTFEKIYKVVSRIPQGKVTTYGNIGVTVGVSPRVVGYALHANKSSDNVPCHRVVFKDGSLASGYAFGGKDVQKLRLTKEGVKFLRDKVDLAASLFS